MASPRHWPCVLAVLVALPVSLAGESLEVGTSVATGMAPGSYRHELFLAAAEVPLPPPAEHEAVLVDEATGIDPEHTKVSGIDPEQEKDGSMTGATVFVLALVPVIYVVVVAWTNSGIVVVARPQTLTPPQATNFVNELVLVASIEHDITYDLDVEKPEKAKVSAGGLGKVAGQLQRIHPTDLISVHPAYGKTKYGFERGELGQDMPEAKRRDWQQDDSISVAVDGIEQTVRVFRLTVAPKRGEEAKSPQVTYLVLEHPWFRDRTGIYLDQPGSVATLRFFSLWNQAVGVLIAREDPMVYQCPDYHTALAPWYALRACGQARPPPRVTVVLHNAEYQGAISSQQLRMGQVRRLAKILDLPRALVNKHMMIEGGFNMLQAGMKYVLLTQRGFGVCAVSKTYAEESKVKHRVLWPLPEVVGLDNPMLENERPENPSAPEAPPPLAERRRAAKAKLYAHQDFRAAEEGEGQKGFGYLEKNPDARIFVFLGRWVKQKGMDYIADIAEWMVSTHSNLQLAIIGPPGDSFGTYCALKLQILATDPRYMGKLKVLPEFYNINQVGADVKFAFDFCFMPSRDEPFGYVDIEFGWFGALTVGSITGGLGKVPGVYFIPSNVNSAAHICHLFKGCVDRAMALSDRALMAIAEEATRYAFPVQVWQADLLDLYKKALDEGKRVGISTAYLRARPEVYELFSRPALERRPKAPRRADLHRRAGIGSLEPSPVSFSLQQMQDQVLGERVGRVQAVESFSLRPGGEAVVEPMEAPEFIRREVDDSAIQGAVEAFVRGQAQQEDSKCCSCKEAPSAQDVLAVTQWEAMKDGEFTESQHLSLGQPLLGACQCLTKYLTAWLAGSFLGLKRIDFFIAIHYLTAPFLQALCVAELPHPEKNRWPAVLGGMVLPFAIVFWTKFSMITQPNRVMSIAIILRVPLLFLPTLAPYLALDYILARIVLFCLLNFLAGADQIFVFYNFMGAAIGDISKLSLRMGMCSGIMGATAYFGQVAISYAVAEFPMSVNLGGATPLSYLGLLFDVLLFLFYICAPAPYRDFCLPEWDLNAMWQHRRTLKYLGANIVLGALTDPSVSAMAVVLWRAALEPFSKHRFLGFAASAVYAWLMPVLLAVAVVAWSYLLYRAPNRSASMVKAGAFLLVPPSFLRCVMALVIKNNDSYVTAIDILFLVSLILDVVRSTCVYIALLSVVGSRWRFISFLTVALFFRQLLAAFVKFVTTLLFDLHIEGTSSYSFALRWMPVLLLASLLQWCFSIGGFFCFDRESSALLTVAKRRLAADNNRGLGQYLRSLEQ